MALKKVKWLFRGRPVYWNNNNNGLNGNNNLDNNNGRFLGIVKQTIDWDTFYSNISYIFSTKRQKRLKAFLNLQLLMSFAPPPHNAKKFIESYERLYSIENLELAFKKARRGKTEKPYVVEFEKSLKENLTALHDELLSFDYSPRPLKTFILRDPKTRKISKSDFRDRVIHHAICNIIEPTFEKTFIHDSYANRIGKGTLNAIKRFDVFKKKVSKNNTIKCFVLKADIKSYFDTVNHNILMSILAKKIPDGRILWLIRKVLDNHPQKLLHSSYKPEALYTTNFTI